MKRKRLLTILILVLSFTIASSFAYATVTYIMNKVVDQPVTVGNTVQYTDGLIVELESFEPYTLTFFELEESDTQKHYITYVYAYTVLVPGMNIEVSSLSDNIVVSELVSTESTISITFSLNQEMEFNEGDILNVQFYFEAVDYSVININDTTIEELLSVGFSESEAMEIVALTYNVSSLSELYSYIYIFDAITRFEHLVNDGTIVFE